MQHSVVNSSEGKTRYMNYMLYMLQLQHDTYTYICTQYTTDSSFPLSSPIPVSPNQAEVIVTEEWFR